MTQNPWNPVQAWVIWDERNKIKKTYHSKKQRERIDAGRNEKNKMKGMWISKKEKDVGYVLVRGRENWGRGNWKLLGL